jgi:hypothetical protein
MPIKSYNKGARKAYRAMQKQYGAKKGRQVFFALANKRGKGKSRKQRVNSTYRTRTRTRRRRR